MPVLSLPDEPSLEQLRNQAKDLRRAALAGQPEALRHFGQQPLIDLLEPLTTPESHPAAVPSGPESQPTPIPQDG